MAQVVERVSCSVADQFCDAPANGPEETRARAVCFRCGMPVCTKCSSRRKYHNYGIVRLCNNCQTEEDGNDDIVMRRLRRLAGYT